MKLLSWEQENIFRGKIQIQWMDYLVHDKKPKEKGQKMCWFRGSYQRPLHRIQLRTVVPTCLLSTHRTIGFIEYQNPYCPIFQISAH